MPANSRKCFLRGAHIRWDQTGKFNGKAKAKLQEKEN